jgi:hypothetical protein
MGHATGAEEPGGHAKPAGQRFRVKGGAFPVQKKPPGQSEQRPKRTRRLPKSAINRVFTPRASGANTALYNKPNCAESPKSSHLLFAPPPSTVVT